jgi:hypothetical protein
VAGRDDNHSPSHLHLQKIHVAHPVHTPSMPSKRRQAHTLVSLFTVSQQVGARALPCDRALSV